MCPLCGCCKSQPQVGLQIVHRPQSPTADLIFVHGLNGDCHSTWTNGGGEFWLGWLEGHFPDVRVWTYGYNAEMVSSSGLDPAGFLSELSRSCRSVRIFF